MLNDWGIRAEHVPEREDRLKAWSNEILKLAKKVKAMYPNRVHIVALKDLNSFGKGFEVESGIEEG